MFTKEITRPSELRLSRNAIDKSPNQPTHLGYLDGLRGGAALWVLLAHCMIWGGWYGIPLPNPKVAVDVFMVISGFLMAHLAIERQLKEPVGEMSTAFKFWTRRLFRIAPLYFLILATVFIFGDQYKDGTAVLQEANPARWSKADPVYLAQNIHFTLKNFLMHVSFLFGMSPTYSFSTLLPDWSIGLEMQFYAVFPFIFLLFVRFRPVVVGVLLALAGYAIEKLVGYKTFPEPSFLPLKIELFVVGMLIAYAATSPAQRKTTWLAALTIAAIASKFMFALATLLIFMSSEHRIKMLARLKTALSYVFGNRIARFMADTSYCVYLIHGFFISLAGGWLYRQPGVMLRSPMKRTLLLTAITLAGSYGAGIVLHHLVEKRGIKLGQKVLGQKKS